MKPVFAVSSEEQLTAYRRFYEEHHARLDKFLHFLENQLAVHSLPRCVVLTNLETATQLLSDIPIPAYTNDCRTVFCPETDVWKKLYLQQAERPLCPEIMEYYETKLTENHLLQILGHELVHHSDLFLDDAWERSRWFEEGMCEYISRKYFLSEKEFQEEVRINALLTSLYEGKHGIMSPEAFSAASYQGPLGSVFYLYWKSFLTVHTLVQQKSGDVTAVFREYHRWFQEAPEMPLLQWFRM